MVMVWHAALALLFALHFGAAAGMSFRRPGGETVELLPWELVRDESQRHAACNLKVLDARDPAFAASWLESLGEPVLIKNLIGHWRALERWTPEWFREKGVGELQPSRHSPIKAWNFTDAKSPQCGDCDWSRQWGPIDRDVSRYFDEWNARVEGSTDLKEPNALIFDPSHDCDSGVFDADAPLPEAFAPFCGNRHVALAAFGTSHGLHRHASAWQGQITGFKSWWLLPAEVYTKPVDVTTHEIPFGFPHESKVQRVNNLCGYEPTVPEVRDRVRNCVQGPGEVMFVPWLWWHGTCSLDEFSTGSGGGLFLGDNLLVSFQNHMPVELRLLFVADGGQEMHLDNVKAHNEHTIRTSRGHAFRFVRTDNGHYVGEFVSPGGPPNLEGSTPYKHHIWVPSRAATEL